MAWSGGNEISYAEAREVGSLDLGSSTRLDGLSQVSRRKFSNNQARKPFKPPGSIRGGGDGAATDFFTDTSGGGGSGGGGVDVGVGVGVGVGGGGGGGGGGDSGHHTPFNYPLLTDFPLTDNIDYGGDDQQQRQLPYAPLVLQEPIVNPRQLLKRVGFVFFFKYI